MLPKYVSVPTISIFFADCTSKSKAAWVWDIPGGAGYDARGRTHPIDNQYTTTALGLGVGTPAQSVYRSDVKSWNRLGRVYYASAYAIADAFR